MNYEDTRKSAGHTGIHHDTANDGSGVKDLRQKLEATQKGPDTADREEEGQSQGAGAGAPSATAKQQDVAACKKEHDVDDEEGMRKCLECHASKQVQVQQQHSDRTQGEKAVGKEVVAGVGAGAGVNVAEGSGQLKQLLGDSFLRGGAAGDNQCTFDDVLKDKSIVLVYFSAQWCAACRRFTPLLKEHYHSWKRAHPDFELCSVSLDGEQEAFDAYFSQHGPWLALPFGSPQIDILKQKFGVHGIPMVVVLGREGSVLTTEGKGEIARLGDKALDLWFEKHQPKSQLAQDAPTTAAASSSCSAPGAHAPGAE